MTSQLREVSAAIDATLTGSSEIDLQIAVARLDGLRIDEQLEVTLDGEPVRVEQETSGVGGVLHRFAVADGALSVRYRARVEGQAAVPREEPFDRALYLRPSRYADSDRLFSYVESRLDTRRATGEIVADVVRFVSGHLDYVPGASRPTDGASDTLLAGEGVCRDYAHLVVALLRAAHIPARLAAVYAPGCDPMDFHAVAEVLVDGRWTAVDATGLAPRQSLLRIATGRDAADTAFLDNHGGDLVLRSSVVTAVVDGELPVDDPAESVAIR